MSKKESRKVKRSRAAKARAREEHTRLVIQRQGDPAYVQQTRTDTGRTIHLRPEEVEMMRAQRNRFIEKLGREPGPDDLVFFDDKADEPTEIDAADMFAHARKAAVQAGIDLGFIDAWEELGYIVTEANQHMFTAHEVEAFGEAVERAADRRAGDSGAG